MEKHIRPPHEGWTIIAGDWNVRLQARLDEENFILGEHIFGRGEVYLNTLSNEAKDNRDTFISWLTDVSYTCNGDMLMF